MRTRKRPKQVGWLGKALARLPANTPLLYPLYLARHLDTVKEDYASPQLPSAFNGMTIAYVSDIHFGALLGEDRVRSLVRRVNEWRADVLILGGDYGENAEGALAFWRLRPGFRAKECVVAALGNHDRTEPEALLPQILDAMRRDGVTPLVNDALLLHRGDSTLALASADDFFMGKPDLEKTARRCAGADFTIFFPHNPDLLPETYVLPGGAFFQLALCGHTHGGQVAVFGHAVKSSSDYGDRYRSGWYRERGVDILVTNGVGTSGLPVRLGARPQVHLITLKQRAEETP